MIHVLVVDDHQLMRLGISALLSKADSIQIVGQARDGLEAIEAVERLKPDVVLMDIEMPYLDGLSATERLAAAGSTARILILSMKFAEPEVRQAYQCGAAGYLVKNSNREELIAAIHSVYEGKRVCSPEVAPYFC